MDVATIAKKQDRAATYPSGIEIGQSRHAATAYANNSASAAGAAIPSRESHEERHCERARHARLGRLRWNTELVKPIAVSNMAESTATAIASAVPDSAKTPTQKPTPKPAPESVVKTIMENAGCIKDD